MLAHGLVDELKGKLVPTGFGIVLFGSEPRLRLPQAALLGTIHYDDDTEETRDFDGPAVNIPDEAIQWLKDKLPNPISRSPGAPVTPITRRSTRRCSAAIR